MIRPLVHSPQMPTLVITANRARNSVQIFVVSCSNRSTWAIIPPTNYTWERIWNLEAELGMKSSLYEPPAQWLFLSIQNIIYSVCILMIHSATDLPHFIFYFSVTNRRWRANKVSPLCQHEQKYSSHANIVHAFCCCYNKWSQF